jgi:hypothetical protein
MSPLKRKSEVEEAVYAVLNAVERFTEELSATDAVEFKAYVEAKYPALFPLIFDVMTADTRLAILKYVPTSEDT